MSFKLAYTNKKKDKKNSERDILISYMKLSLFIYMFVKANYNKLHLLLPPTLWAYWFWAYSGFSWSSDRLKKGRTYTVKQVCNYITIICFQQLDIDCGRPKKREGKYTDSIRFDFLVCVRQSIRHVSYCSQLLRAFFFVDLFPAPPGVASSRPAIKILPKCIAMTWWSIWSVSNWIIKVMTAVQSKI